MEKKKRMSNLAFVLKMAGTRKGKYIASVILALCNAACVIIPFMFLANMLEKLIDDVTYSRTFDSSFYLTRLAIMGGIWVLALVTKYLSTVLSHMATFDVLKNIRMGIANSLSKMPLGDIERLNPGTIKSIMVERVDSVETTLAHIVPEVSSGLVASIFLLTWMFVIDWRLGLGSFACVFVGAIFFAFMMKGSGPSFKNCVDKTKILNDTAVDYINGIEVIKVFGKENDSYDNFKKAAHDGAYCFIDWMRRCLIPQTGGLVICPYTLLGILPIATILYMNNSLELSKLIMVIVLSVTAISFLLVIFSYQDDMSRFGVIKDEVCSLLDADTLIRPETLNKKIEGNDIEISNVSFGYNQDNEVLHDVSLKIKKNTFTAFVGKSGAGKSTLAKLIASYYDPTKGDIKIGGVSLKDIPLEKYNELVSYVSQNNYLFNMSIYDNIRVAKKDATDKEIEEICKKCGVDSFIRGLENGYNTVVGSKGNSLSGGEKQRISIARAMMKNAPIVILDEATAYTDPENESLIQKSISALVKDKTLIVIAHRLNTITEASSIVVVDEGKINGMGTHQELLKNNKVYQEMWNSFKESEAK